MGNNQGAMPSLHSPFFSLCGACLTMRGAVAPSALPEASRQTWLLPPSEGAPPLRPWEFMRGWQPLHPPAGAPREHGKAMLGTRVTFPSRGKSPKARKIPRCGVSALFALATHRAGLPSATNSARFATLSLWANRSLFLPKLCREPHFLLLIRGTVGGVSPEDA